MKITITGGGKATDVTQYVTTVTWGGDYQSCARTLSFGILSSPTDRTIEKVRCDLMDAVAFDHNGRIFDGYIFRREKSTNESEITITCFDKASILERLPRRINLREQRLRRSRAASAQTMGFRLVVSHERALLYRATSWGKIYTILSKASPPTRAEWIETRCALCGMDASIPISAHTGGVD